MKLVSRLSLLAAVLLVALIPASALAADGTDDGDFILQINRPVVIEAGESVDALVVVSDDATVAGTVTEGLFVIDGDAWISGAVEGDVTVVSGTLHLLSGSQTDHISLVRSELVREDGAVVTGSIDRTQGVDFWSTALFSIVFWLGMTLVLLVSGLVFAAIGGRQLARSAALLGQRTAGSIGWAAILFIGLPLLSVPVILTLVGIPLGVGILLFLLPALWFLGFIVAATAAGGWLVRRFGWSEQPEHPYLAVAVGVAVFGVIGAIPWLGGLFAFFAGIVGAGAMAYAAWRGWRGSAVPAEPRPQPSAPSPA
ncbi:MAG TPA: hypothetical protein PKA95_08775 [Thermomicrobiales bacterium]|nr:hypothetical protein [Thermomicrobiales bacterium]